MIPEQIGNYKIEKKIGSGGMGTVYLGTDAETGRVAAIKVLSGGLSSDGAFIARFDREIKALQSLTDPHIVEFYDSGQDAEMLYYAMEYVEGETLTQRLKAGKRLPWQDVIDIAVQICSALKAAHVGGIIHRDIKPSNLMMTANGDVKLTDFGVAQVFAGGQLTMTGGIIGTAEYMSPEQAFGQRATKKSDLYSLGAVMYTMLTGRPPFSGKTTVEVLQKHKFGKFDPAKTYVPEIPHWLDEVVNQCLEKKPEDRFPDAYVLSLRLSEIAKKVELSQSKNTTDSPSFDSTAVTRVAQGDEGSSPQELGGTLMRDMVRASIEIENKQTTVERIFDNIYVLIGLLFLVFLGGWYFWQFQNPSAEKRYEYGKTLFDSGEGHWHEARDKYFQPLVEEDFDKWTKKVSPYLREIEIYDIKKTFGLESKTTFKQRKQKDVSEPHRLLLQAKGYYELGDLAKAEQTLLALSATLQEDPSQAVFRQAVIDIRNAMYDRNEILENRKEWIESVLNRAQELIEKNQHEQAEEILEAILVLYAEEPRVSEQIKLAKTLLEK